MSSTRDAPSARRYYQESLIAALERNGLPTTTIAPTTKMLTLFPRRTLGYVPTRSVPVSLRFLVDVARAPGRFVIASEYGIETFLTLLVARLTGHTPLVFQEHTGRAGERLGFADILYRRCVGALAGAFVANTAAAADEIKQVLRIDPARVFQLMTLIPPDREELCREPWALEQVQARPLFLYTGQLITRKNVDTMLHASALLRREGLAFEVWIGGEGPDQARLQQITRELGLDGAVRFIGPVPYSSIGHVYAACDAFIMPSHADYRSVAVLEAMRFGKPIIDSANDGNAGDTARHGENAFIFDPRQPSALADCMRKFIATPDLAREMGARSEAIMQEHTPDNTARALIGVLSSLRRSPP